MGSNTRMDRDDWLELGLERLAAKGPRSLRLEDLCAAAGRTRGSFYHHFEDHAAFLDALGDHWRRSHTEALVDPPEERATADRPRAIRRLATRVDAATELGMRRLAAGNARIQTVVDEVDRSRLDHMTRLHASRPGVSRNQAAAFAWLEYAAYVGSQALWPGVDPEELAKTGDLLGDCLEMVTAREPG